MGKFSKKARRKAKRSKARTEKMLADAASRSGPVRVYYLPGFQPPTTPGPTRQEESDGNQTEGLQL